MKKIEWNKMGDAKRNRLVAELCGWYGVHTFKVDGKTTYYGWHPQRHNQEVHRYEIQIPNFLEDLNAMRQAEAWGEAESPSQFPGRYMRSMENILYPTKPGLRPHYHFTLIRATAIQRAEAFYKAMTETWP